MSDSSSERRGGKDLTARAGYALAKAGKGGKPMRYTDRDKYIEDLQRLLQIFDKAGPFVTGQLTFPRPDAAGPGGLCAEDVKLASQWIDPTSAAETMSRPIFGIGDLAGTSADESTILNTSMVTTGEEGTGVKVNMGLLAACTVSMELAKSSGGAAQWTGGAVVPRDTGGEQTTGSKPTAEKLKAEYRSVRELIDELEEKMESVTDEHVLVTEGVASAQRTAQRARRARAPYVTSLAVMQGEIEKSEALTARLEASLAAAQATVDLRERESVEADRAAENVATGTTGINTAMGMQSGWEVNTAGGWASCRVDVAALYRDLQALEDSSITDDEVRIRGEMDMPEDGDTSTAATTVRDIAESTGVSFAVETKWTGRFRRAGRAAR